MGGFFQQSSSGNGQVYFNIAFSCLKASHISMHLSLWSSFPSIINPWLQASQYEQQMYEQQQREAQIYEQQQQQQMQMQM